MAPAIAVAVATTLCAWSNRNGGASQGDPDRAADILVRIVHAGNLPSHLLLGAGAANMALNYSRGQITEATAWQAVSASADAGAGYPVDLPTTH
jgi:hypothetical protein